MGDTKQKHLVFQEQVISELQNYLLSTTVEDENRNAGEYGLGGSHSVLLKCPSMVSDPPTSICLELVTSMCVFRLYNRLLNRTPVGGGRYFVLSQTLQVIHMHPRFLRKIVVYGPGI